MKRILILLIALSFSVFLFEIFNNGFLPIHLSMPLVGTYAIIVTLIIAYVSYSQWQKSRLENEVLKEQLKLIIEFFDHIRKNPNPTTIIGDNDNKIVLSGFVPFSIINYSEIESLSPNLIITQQLACNVKAREWFNEIDNNIISNPFFPKKLFSCLMKLKTSNYFLECGDVGRKWFTDGLIVPAEEQLLLMKELKDTAGNASRPIVFPYNADYLRIKDILDIYKEFHIELNTWFQKHNIEIELNLNA